MIELLQQTLAIFVESAPYLLVGFALAGLSSVFLEKDSWLARSLGRKGPRSVALASVIGAPLPLCSCSVLPAAIGLKRQGASKGATSSFLISVPETDVVSVLLTYGLLGPVMAIARPVAALATAFTTGVVVDLVDRERADTKAASSEDQAHEHGATRNGPWWRRAAHFGFVEFFDDITGPLVVGLLLAGGVAVLVPAFDSFGFADTVWLGYLVALVFGIPSYVCATATTPVAVGLILAGMSPGAVLTLLLVGPATNVASFVVLGREFGRKILIVYLLGIAIVGVAFGVLLDVVWGADAVRLGAAGTASSMGASWFSQLSAVVLAVLVFTSLKRTRAVGRTWARIAVRFGGSASPRMARGVAITLIAVIWLSSGLFTLGPGERAVVTAFGREASGVLGPGLHVTWPVPIADVHRLDVNAIRALEFGFRRDVDRDTRVAQLPRGREVEAWMLTGDENIVDVRAVLHWRVQDDDAAVRALLFDVAAPEVLLRAGLERGLRAGVGRRGIDALLTEDRGALEVAVRDRWLQPFLDRCAAGIDVVDVAVVDLHAPNAVHWSFRDVASASEDRRRDVHLAAEYAERVVREARGDAAGLVATAIGDAAMRRGEANGQSIAFTAQVEAFADAPEIHRRRLYLERLESTLTDLDLLIDLSGDAAAIELWRGGRPSGVRATTPPPLRLDAVEEDH